VPPGAPDSLVPVAVCAAHRPNIEEASTVAATSVRRPSMVRRGKRERESEEVKAHANGV